MIGSIVLSTVGSIAAKVGAPLIKGLVEKHAGPIAGSVTGAVLEAIASKLGVPADEIPNASPAAIERAVVEVEAESADVIAAWSEQQRLANELMTAEMTTEPVWTWAWRPAWMWLLAFLWTYGLVIRPLVNAALGSSIEVLDLGTLMTLTGVYVGLYMGGHTVKDVAQKLRSGK